MVVVVVGGWVMCKPILVFNLSLGQAKQKHYFSPHVNILHNWNQQTISRSVIKVVIMNNAANILAGVPPPFCIWFTNKICMNVETKFNW